jgi:hypothetical protein
LLQEVNSLQPRDRGIGIESSAGRAQYRGIDDGATGG